MHLQLDVNFPDDPLVMALSLDAIGLYVVASCVAKRLNTCGVLHRGHFTQLTSDYTDSGPLGELLRCGLVTALDDEYLLAVEGFDADNTGPFETGG